VAVTGGDTSSGVRIRHLPVTRRARVAVLGSPGPAVQELWIVLHGYRQLAPYFIRRFADLAGPERMVVAPEALNRFYLDDDPGRHGPESRVGATWMTREDRETEIRDYVDYLDTLHETLAAELPGRVRTVGLGFSQGVHTLARWGALGRSRAHTLVFWGEVLPPDLDLEAGRAAFSGVRLVSVQGRKDAHLTPELLARQEEQLRTAGHGMEVHWHPGGHRLEAETLQAVLQELEGGRGTGEDPESSAP
jgi:predicted esterase